MIPQNQIRLLTDVRDGMKLGITGTPAYIIGEQLYLGQYPTGYSCQDHKMKIPMHVTDHSWTCCIKRAHIVRHGPAWHFFTGSVANPAWPATVVTPLSPGALLSDGRFMLSEAISWRLGFRASTPGS